MSLIKRISTSITTTIDNAVRRVENHDAVIDAALKEARAAAARTRVRLARVQKDGRGLKARHAELTEAVQKWTERARRVGAEDEQRALACLRRRKECEAQVRQLADALTGHEQLEARVSANLKKIEARIAEVAQQRNVMRSRQSVSEAMRIINDVEGSSYGDIEDAFDRWEINLSESEVMFGSACDSDTLDTEFLREEDESGLRAELAELLDDDREVK